METLRRKMEMVHFQMEMRRRQMEKLHFQMKKLLRHLEKLRRKMETRHFQMEKPLRHREKRPCPEPRRRKQPPGRARSPAKSQPGGQRRFGVDERGNGRLKLRAGFMRDEKAVEGHRTPKRWRVDR